MKMNEIMEVRCCFLFPACTHFEGLYVGTTKRVTKPRSTNFSRHIRKKWNYTRQISEGKN